MLAAEEKAVLAALRKFAGAVRTKMTTLTVGEPEDQLRAPFENFMQEVGQAVARRIVCTGETRLPGRLGKPDYAVHGANALVGYAELKAPGIGANPIRFTGRNLHQWKRFSAIPNLIYCDGNEEQSGYVAWLGDFGEAAYRVLKETGSFVVDLGGAYQRGKPIRSLCNFRVLIDFCDRLKYSLAEESFWYNPAKLPSPIEWVNKRKSRVKDAVNTVWWFSKGNYPKADVTKVLTPYSDRMKTLLKNPEKFYKPKERPSGHDIAATFGKENGGAIPSNLLTIPNTESTSHYLRMCKLLGKDGHPARFPAGLPKFFVEFLTEPGDVVVDIFSGSNTTGSVAEQLGRKWLSTEMDRDYAVLSAVRFMERCTESDIIGAMKSLESGQCLRLGFRGFSATNDASGDGEPVEESQGSLFTQSHAGPKYR